MSFLYRQSVFRVFVAMVRSLTNRNDSGRKSRVVVLEISFGRSRTIWRKNAETK
jgi:hypothetical protein